MNEKNYSKVPVFENGLAQPVFPLTDGKTGEKLATVSEPSAQIRQHPVS